MSPHAYIVWLHLFVIGILFLQVVIATTGKVEK